MNQTLDYEVAAVMPAAYATGRFVSVCTFLLPDGSLGPSGAPSNVFALIVGLTNIPCMDAPKSIDRILADEMRQTPEIQAEALRHVLLNSWYPAAKDAWRAGAQATVDGVMYNVVGVEDDSQNTQTRMTLQLATV